MTRLRDKMGEDLQLRGLCPNTLDTYLRGGRRFVDPFGVPPAKRGAAEVRRSLLFLLNEAKASPSTVNTYAAAIRFLYGVTLKRPDVVADVVRLKTPMRVPRILSGTEVERRLAAIPTTKHRAMGMLASGAGLRVSEIARLESGDIDAKRMVLHVRNAKRGRERHVMLSPILLSALRASWKDARPPGPRLFPGCDPSKPITRTAIHKALCKAAQKAAITKRLSPHVLRHSFATHLLEGGTDMRTVQILLGHASQRSTVTYVHVTTARVQELRSRPDLPSPRARDRDGRRALARRRALAPRAPPLPLPRRGHGGALARQAPRARCVSCRRTAAAADRGRRGARQRAWPVAFLRRCPVCGANAVVRQPLPELHARAALEAA